MAVFVVAMAARATFQHSPFFKSFNVRQLQPLIRFYRWIWERLKVLLGEVSTPEAENQ
ncbi:hypothetical protein [Xenorhabdus szentirmaii]|uniref:hypothetical protein n=1 Tax=Xenorhabdus szentirmaii TaxID=290112 RepID=UPI0004B5DC31|nr:hypothetical protein [Xenorhabdus sp. 5]MBD2779104.1 hypothetical protein [Xenorhabdus sp. 38]MBD2824830.1 hypothetical protein [Xenorhabdus sp. 5]